MFNLEESVFIKPNKRKGVIKEKENQKYKTTFFDQNGERKVEWFEESDLTGWRVSKPKNDNIIKCTISDKSLLPKYATICASGMDLKAYDYQHNALREDVDWSITLNPLERVLIKTGLHIELPPNIEAQIRPRSGLALKYGISIVNSPGTIDEDYRGDIGVILVNLSNEPFIINKGDKIAQMVFQRVQKYELNIVDELSITIRGEGGYGSTGVK